MRVSSSWVVVAAVVIGGCFVDSTSTTTSEGSSGSSTSAICDQGALGCACFPNGTCESGLACAQGTCEVFDEGTTAGPVTTGPDDSTGTPEPGTTTAVDTGSSESSSGDVGPAHVLFTSSTQVSGSDLGGLTGADDLCTTLGQGVRPGPWVAVLGDAVTSLSARVDVGGEVVNTVGELLATSKVELLSGQVQNKPGYDEQGAEISGSELAWTGASGEDCVGWTIDEPTVFGAAGLPASTDLWLDTRTPLPCSASPRIYCLSQ